MLTLKGKASFTDEARIQAEGQKDGERNIPEMGAYTPAQFEQALVAFGEQQVQQVYERASRRIAKLQPVFEGCQRRLEDLEARFKPLVELYEARKKELGRDAAIPFPSVYHVALI